jgi:hypothetical protein
MSAANDLDKAPTLQESEKKDTVTETIEYARRTYKGNHPDAKAFEPGKYVFVLFHLHVCVLTAHSNGPVKRFLNNISHSLTSNRYGGS